MNRYKNKVKMQRYTKKICAWGHLQRMNDGVHEHGRNECVDMARTNG